MDKNIDLIKILKNCPIGWEFYSSIYGNVAFCRIEADTDCPIVFFFIGKDKVERYGRVTERGLESPVYNGENTFFPSKTQRDWSKFTAPWYKKGRFDPKTLKPFDKVLIRNIPEESWCCCFFSHICNDIEYFKYITTTSGYQFCIPYNDDTKHLVGTTEEAPEYYRYWEK